MHGQAQRVCGDIVEEQQELEDGIRCSENLCQRFEGNLRTVVLLPNIDDLAGIVQAAVEVSIQQRNRESQEEVGLQKVVTAWKMCVLSTSEEVPNELG